MVNLYEDSEFIDQPKAQGAGVPPARDPLFYRGAHLPGKYNRYEPGYSSPPSPRVKTAGEQAWELAPLGGYGHDEPRYYSDEELRRMIEESIHADPLLSGEEKRAVQITVERGQVTLSGKVHSSAAKEQIESDAYWTEGAGNVRNLMEVVGEEKNRA